jgi:hypothetical protein
LDVEALSIIWGESTPTKIAVSGIVKRGEGRQYAEEAISLTIDEDITEAEAVALVLTKVESMGARLYRKLGQAEDRVSVSYIGVQRDEPMIRLQLRDAAGRFLGYDALGRQLWGYEGRPGTQPKDAAGNWITFAAYARARGIQLATGLVSQRIHTTKATAEARITESLSTLEFRQPRPGSFWRREGVQRVKSVYKQMYLEGEE